MFKSMFNHVTGLFVFVLTVIFDVHVGDKVVQPATNNNISEPNQELLDK